MIRQTPEERAEWIIRTEALYGPDIDTNSIRITIVMSIRQAVEVEAERRQRIEAAARTFLDEVTHFGSGATAARKALVEALES